MNFCEMPSLLTRDQFREGVFARDNHKCVICGAPAKDAHHIIERRLFDDGGYYLDNGASVCEEHHIQCEQTTLSCEDVRKAANIKNVILPPHLYHDSDYTYDKWGNIILPTGQRLKGELFFDESVQKILKQGGVLDLFSNYIKYPRTHHLPWSEKKTKDDRTLENTKQFEGKNVIVSVKLDGENTTLYNDYLHARSINSGKHPSRRWITEYWSQIKYHIPDGWRVCGENLYALHTIPYKNLDSYFYLFSIWNEKNECLSWEETIEYAEILDIRPVPILYAGIWDEHKIRNLYKIEKNKKYMEINGDGCEGYVVRVADKFSYGDFRKNVAKFVSSAFEIKHGHWTQSFEKNELKSTI